MQNLLNLTVLRNGITPLRDKIGPLPFPPPGLGPGKLEVVSGTGFIGFKLNGTLIWLIDVHRFAGTPALTVDSPQPDTTRIQLKNARFPGTQMAADFVCTIGKTGLFGTPMDITFTLGNFHGQTIMERWLAATQALESIVTVGGEVCPLGVTSSLTTTGQAQARFYPDWIMTMNGSALATLSGLGPDLSSDTFAFKLLFPGEPEFLQGTNAIACVICLS